jgi:hypothetical protein
MLQEIFDWTARHQPNQVKALEKRKGGSQWKNGYLSWDAIARLPWQKLDRKDYREVIHFAFCDYYYIYGSHIGIQEIKLLSDFLDEEVSRVFLREGNHGIELACDRALIFPEPTNQAWLIVGQAAIDSQPIPNKKMVWTCYPGLLSASIRLIPEFDGSVQSLIEVRDRYPIAVKPQ